MKLEKVNDHQIRCTLTKADLADRHMKLSELAYGSDKAKSLFRDMMQQAAYEFGFEAEDIPLMIEAIPLSGDCIVLIITKVEDPDELDTRFSKFAPSLDEDSDDSDDSSEESPAIPSLSVTADDVIDLFKKLHSDLTETAERLASQSKAEEKDKPGKEKLAVSVAEDMVRMYRFDSLDDAIRLAHVLKGFYDGENDLYKSTTPEGFYLVLHKSAHTAEQFNKVCNILAEYSSVVRYTKGSNAFLSEHASVMLSKNALQKLAQIEA